MFTIKKEYSYDLPLPFASNVDGTTITTKKGTLLKILCHQLQKEFNVDISPFPGFSSYTLEESLFEFKAKLSLLAHFSTIEYCFHPNPHVEFALYQLFSQVHQWPQFDLKTNHLYGRVQDSLTSFFSQHKNIECLKIKIFSSLQLEDNLHHLCQQLTKHFQQTAPKKFFLRWDANKSLTLREWETSAKILQHHKLLKYLDFFEEPLVNTKHYQHHNKNSLENVPYVLEESIDQWLENPESYPFCQGIVFKPSQQGIKKALDIKAWKKKSSNHRFRLILSSCWEIGPALAALKTLKPLLELPAHEYHGLQATLQANFNT